MAGVSSCAGQLTQLLLPRRRIHGFRCCSSAPKKQKVEFRTPQLLKIAVTTVTQVLRFFSFDTTESLHSMDEFSKELPVSGVDDVLMMIKSDYERAYFVTGSFTSAMYAENCIFEDPTIRFRGRELYSRNLKLLVPFFDNPSIELQTIEKGIDSGREFVAASWKLRTYLKLPWRPLISVDGSTVYELDDDFKIVRHAESWNISALEAVGQIFTPNFQGSGE